MNTQQLVALKDVSKNKDVQVIFNLGEGEIGYGYISLTEENLYRSNQYQSRLKKESFANFESLDKELSDSKLYLQEDETPLEALNQILSFWYHEPTKEVNVSEVKTDEEAVEALLSTNVPYLFYVL